MHKMPKAPKGVMTKKDNRGEFAKQVGKDTSGKKKALVSFVEGTKDNKALQAKSLTPKAPMTKKRK